MSILLAGGVIWAADYYSSPQVPSTITSAPTSAITSQGLDWKKALATIQGEPTLPTPPSEEVVASLLAASETSNVTETIGRTILVNLSEAKSQGLGSDIPTQEKIVENALSKINTAQNFTSYTSSELTAISDSPETLRAYGNGVITILENNPGASAEAVLLAVGNATDTGDKSYLTELQTIANTYKNIAAELAALPVPSTMTPMHLQIVNNFLRISVACTDMSKVLTDPILGLSGIRSFQSISEETSRLFINIAQALDKNGILFTESEPGAAWSLLIAP
jgi:hypothetical protein